MTAIDLCDRDGRKVTTAYHTPSGDEVPALVVWRGVYYVRVLDRSYVETFAWPVFTRAELELEGMRDEDETE